MMATVPSGPFEQSIQLIRETEKSLRGLLAKAAEEGNYDEGARIMACAKELKGVLDRIGSSPASARRSGESPPDPGGYPKFFKDENKLVMVGWSKKRQTTYKHEAPKSVLDLLVSELVKACSDGKPVPSNELLPLKSLENGSEYPDYYARTFLRWLRSIGVVRQFGHRGYSIRTDLDYQSIINSRWKRLAARS